MDQAPPLAHPSRQSALRAVQASKDHQYALRVYTERLETELQTVDKLLVCRFLRVLLPLQTSYWIE